MFTVQTQEVIPELNKIKELLEQKPQEKPVVIVEEKEINNEPAQEVNKEPVEEIKEFVSAEDNVVERAKEYLKDKGTKGLHLYKDNQKIIDKAIKEGFTM